MRFRAPRHELFDSLLKPRVVGRVRLPKCATHKDKFSLRLPARMGRFVRQLAIEHRLTVTEVFEEAITLMAERLKKDKDGSGG